MNYLTSRHRSEIVINVQKILHTVKDYDERSRIVKNFQIDLRSSSSALETIKNYQNHQNLTTILIYFISNKNEFSQQNHKEHQKIQGSFKHD